MREAWHACRLLTVLPMHTGKTTFIKHLLGREYPGIHIGPEPTTDRFVVVYDGHDERRTPGNTLAVQTDKPYQASPPPILLLDASMQPRTL